MNHTNSEKAFVDLIMSNMDSTQILSGLVRSPEQLYSLLLSIIRNPSCNNSEFLSKFSQGLLALPDGRRVAEALRTIDSLWGYPLLCHGLRLELLNQRKGSAPKDAKHMP